MIKIVVVKYFIVPVKVTSSTVLESDVKMTTLSGYVGLTYKITM